MANYSRSKMRAAGDDDISALHFDGVTLGGSAAGAKSKSHKEVFAWKASCFNNSHRKDHSAAAGLKGSQIWGEQQHLTGSVGSLKHITLPLLHLQHQVTHIDLNLESILPCYGNKALTAWMVFHPCRPDTFFQNAAFGQGKNDCLNCYMVSKSHLSPLLLMLSP